MNRKALLDHHELAHDVSEYYQMLRITKKILKENLERVTREIKRLETKYRIKHEH